MGGEEVNAFLTWLATEKNVSASTQNQALGALLLAGIVMVVFGTHIFVWGTTSTTTRCRGSMTSSGHRGPCVYPSY